MSSEGDLNLVYVILIICILTILAFFMYKLNSKVNELSEFVNNLKDQILLDDNKDPEEDKTPKLEETNEEPLDKLDTTKETLTDN